VEEEALFSCIERIELTKKVYEEACGISIPVIDG